MGDFRKPHGNRNDDRGGNRFGGRDGGRPSFGDRQGGGRDFGGRPEMFQATCAQCGKTCEVPFRPNGKKPVYCLDCFNGGKAQAPSRDNFPRKEYSAPAPFSKPQTPQTEDTRLDDLKRKMDSIQTKLDKVLETVETVMRAVAAVEKEKEVSKAVKAATEGKKPIKVVKAKTAKKK